MGLEPTNPKERFYRPPQLPLCEPAITDEKRHRSPSFWAVRLYDGMTIAASHPTHLSSQTPKSLWLYDEGGQVWRPVLYFIHCVIPKLSISTRYSSRFHILRCFSPCGLAGVEGFEPPCVGFGVRCLRPLGDTPIFSFIWTLWSRILTLPRSQHSYLTTDISSCQHFYFYFWRSQKAGCLLLSLRW